MSTKKLSNSFSTGGGGVHFENHVQASYVVLMLTRGYAPALPCWPIETLKLQGKVEGIETDDMIVTVMDSKNRRRKMFCQIKHSIEVLKTNEIFQDVVNAAWADFCNKNVFLKSKDQIALITSIINRVDYSLIKVLDEAKHVNDKEVFFNRLEQANYISNDGRRKFNILIECLRLANDGKELSKKEIFEFSRTFNILIYDVGREESVALSLIRSHMAQFCTNPTKMIWGSIVDFVGEFNQSAGIIDYEMIPIELKDEFNQYQGKVVLQEEDILNTIEDHKTVAKGFRNDLLVLKLAMIGSWNAKNENDIEAIVKFVGMDYEKVEVSIREEMNTSSNIFSVNSSVWKVQSCHEIYKSNCSKLIESDFDQFKEMCIVALDEISTRYLNEEENDFGFAMTDNFTFSNEIRKGLVNGLAIIGSSDVTIESCSIDYHKTIVNYVIYSLLRDKDWKYWISIEQELPVLCEGGPKAFLSCLIDELNSKKDTFRIIQSKEGSGIFGKNHLTGLLWALEKLAWTKEYFQESILALGELAEIDSGGNWANRPINSIIDILLPWHPQTLVDFSEKQIAVSSLMTEFEGVAYDVIISLLPNQSSTTTGTCKPIYLNVDIPEKVSVLNSEYYQEIDWYSNAIIDLLETNIERNNGFIKNINSLTNNAYERYMKLLKSEMITNLDENERGKIWSELLEFINHHTSYPDADWSMSKEKIEQLIDVSEAITPKNYLLKIKRLFTYDEYKLLSDNEDYDTQKKQLEKQRIDIIIQILEEESFQGIVELCRIVESPFHVGMSYSVADENAEYYKELSEVLTEKAGLTNEFLKGFLRGLENESKIEMVDLLIRNVSDKNVKLNILISMPFTEKSWDIASKWLGENIDEYWKKTQVNYFSIKEKYILAIVKLNEVKRYTDSISIIYHLVMGKKDVNVDMIENTVLDFAENMNEKVRWDQHSICKIISYLQENSKNTEKLVTIEWTFVRLLDGRSHSPEPKTLSYQMSKEPAFFHQILRMCYKSSIKEKVEKVKEGSASNAWHALHSWNIVPGMTANSEFVYDDFNKWFTEVKRLATESGHYDIALQKIGEVLIYAPSDSSGLWIEKNIAKILNDRKYEHIRRGYSTATFNSRGVHSVDTTGAADYKLAEYYHKKGEELKKQGYIRFANILYGIEQTYIREAESIIKEYKDE